MKRVIFAIVLLSLASAIVAVPAFADMATFSQAGTVTVTLPDITNVTYTLLSNTLTVTPIQEGNAGLVYGSQTFSWNNDTLAYEFDPSFGSVSSPGDVSHIQQEYDTSLQIVNSNDYGVEMPVTMFLSYEGNSTATGLTYSESQVTAQVLDILPGGDTELSVACVDAPNMCSSYVYPGPPQQGLPSPVSLAGSFFLPADSTSTFEIIPQSQGDAGFVPTVPEPSTFGLFGTGLIGLAGIARRKLIS